MRVLANFPELRWSPEKVSRRIAKSFVSCDKQQRSRGQHHVINPIAVIRHPGSPSSNHKLTLHQMRGDACLLSSFAEKRTAGQGPSSM